MLAIGRQPVMPVRLAIPLCLERPEPVLPLYVHALVCECLERGLAPTRHYGNDKPFATSPLRTHADGLYAFEVGLLDDELEERLAAAIRQRSGRLRLGRQTALLAGPPEPMGRATWGDLVRRAVPRRQFEFQFITPTTFRSRQTCVPLPLPKSVFGHYRSRWQAFAPPELRPDVAFDDLELLIDDCAIETRPYAASRRDLVGFTGRVTYSLRRARPELHAALDALASIADYAGTGSCTPQGMGVTRYLGGTTLGRRGGRPDPWADGPLSGRPARD